MIFHVINIDDPFLNSYFYALKLISQGRPSRRPHITIRGPFEADHSNLEALNNQLEGNHASIGGLGEFKSQGNHVIFFKCKSEGFSKVWFKPTFPVEKYGINPHITIYDGPGSILSESILKAGKFLDSINFDIKASKLERFITGEKDNATEALKLISEISQRPNCTIEDIKKLNVQDRINILSLLFTQLAKYVAK